ncbi:hypothetical protein VN12_21700 [Pirellula sp. SH-Sr6A]|uniref:DUF58 domain-containing protein n=1 Tax=Pirellula sp. SH-Sr6A TaxID=1632865 RepID=UPI00078BB3B8|nr:DUF58 domain-containing protein [Pirellula sp. SH-Sr6A]AMV34756.1 hypothetical protein VN12_21700 [Pirellula sp. SH-Sr6A]
MDQTIDAQQLYDSVGSYLFWAPWIGLALLLLPLLVLAWGWRIYPTLRWLWFLLPLSFATVLVAIDPLYRHFIVVLDLVAVSFVVLDLLTITSQSGIRVERQMVRSASLGGTHPVKLLVENRSDRLKRIVMRDDLPTELSAKPEVHRFRLDSRKRTEIDYKLTPKRRGTYRFESIYFQLLSRFGLWTRNLRKPLPGELHVYPDMKQLTEYAILARTNRLSLIGVRKTRKAGQDNNFERLRDYTQDDNYKHIDWRSTARRNKLTVKQFQTDQSQRIVFLVDCGRLMTAEYRGLSLLDYALNSMLMLSYVALHQGDSVGLMCFSDRIESYVPVRGGASQMNRLLHASFDRFPTLLQTNYSEAFLHFSKTCRKRSLVVLLTSVIDDVSAAQITGYLTTLRGKHLPLLCLLRDRAVFEYADNPNLDESVLYRSAAAAQLLIWRNDVIQKIQNAGILAVDAFPDALTSPLVNQYLEVKAKHLL